MCNMLHSTYYADFFGGQRRRIRMIIRITDQLSDVPTLPTQYSQVKAIVQKTTVVTEVQCCSPAFILVAMLITGVA